MLSEAEPYCRTFWVSHILGVGVLVDESPEAVDDITASSAGER
jgi:hypothetical protein